MHSTSFSEALLPLSGTDAASEPKRGWLRRFFDAVAASNAAKADRELRRLEAAWGVSLRVVHREAGFNPDDLPFNTRRD